MDTEQSTHTQIELEQIFDKAKQSEAVKLERYA